MEAHREKEPSEMYVEIVSIAAIAALITSTAVTVFRDGYGRIPTRKY